MDTPAPAASPRHPKFVRWALLLGIVVILNVFFTVIVNLAFPAPKYEVYCPAASKPISAPDETACVAAGGDWIATPPSTDPSGVKAPAGYCDFYSKCQKPWEDAQSARNLRAFVLMLGLGVLALLLGLVPINSSIVSSGLSYGGVIALVIGSAQYWTDAGQWLRLAIAGLGLLALLYIGWRQFKDRE